MDLMTLLALEPYGTDSFIGTGPRYPWGGLYGGQIVAQGLRAASATVPPGLVPHSLHASFLRSGSHTEKILFEVERVRDGRSFTNRRVTASQAVGVILTMTASFQVLEEGADVQAVTCPKVPHPDSLPTTGWSSAFECRHVRTPVTVDGSAVAWMRVGTALTDDPLIQACALTYESDDLPTEAVVALHPDAGREDEFHGRFFTASLDHAIWFHRPQRADDWHLQAFECHGLSGSRGTALGHVFASDGTHTATIAQEIVVRRRP